MTGRRWAVLFAMAAVPAQAGDLPPPITDDMYAPVNPAMVEVGHLLFWDPILSGNQNIACATCHHPRFGTSDGVSLSLGEGGTGLGPDRRPDPANMPEQRVPRNAPALFNLGATEFTTLFHDGRIQADPAQPNGLRTPLDQEMVQGFSGVLSAQTMFPVLSQDEMAGHYGENEVSKAVRSGRLTGPGGAWDLIAARVRAIPAYQAAFEAALPEVAAGRPVAFTDISNAIAEFITWEWRADDSPFDRHLRGDAPLTGPALRGMELFYGEAECSTCHAGPFLTDHAFHAMGVPQFGPGKAERFERHSRDEGRFRVTGHPEDLYAFLTPSLRNVAKTAPYGHSGSHRDLTGFVLYHIDPARGLAAYDRNEPLLQTFEGKAVWAAFDEEGEADRISGSIETPPHPLSEDDVAAIVAFLESLTDEASLDGRIGIPDSVPSGLPIDR
ncbi:cytochrome-c peroxidase [Tropicimonas isoalkanivorans]|uniref:Cytochrome c peroxidase n=1 Tax=Tropicimonas isoalkanivorans TaxID=441112 RepID=A0A1I1GNE0_9RHOB|nr:cytochrome c peroxidase [Tropicimonas isoalkanivorans]SFC11408.1 cytochrome c peroxidase [Tropicimonas isoalkanivorans]